MQKIVNLAEKAEAQKDQVSSKRYYQLAFSFVDLLFIEKNFQYEILDSKNEKVIEYFDFDKYYQRFRNYNI